MKYTIFSFLLLILSYNFLISQDSLTANYQNKEYKYSINYPKDWKLSEPYEPYHVVRMEHFSDTNSKSDLSIRIMCYGKGETQELLKTQVKVMRILNNEVKEIKEEELYINGYKGIWKEVTAIDRRTQVKEIYIYIVFKYNDLLYNVWFSGDITLYEKNQAFYLSCLKSFKFI